MRRQGLLAVQSTGCAAVHEAGTFLKLPVAAPWLPGRPGMGPCALASSPESKCRPGIAAGMYMSWMQGCRFTGVFMLSHDSS